jgi:pyruvate ferredoxin oxidoreductase beta subunit
MSSATPFAAETRTASGAAHRRDRADEGHLRDLAGPRASYIATVSPRHPVDLARKFEKAKKIKGPKMFIAFSPCPTGWKYDPSKTPEVAKLAVECGILALKEAVNGDVAHTHVPTKRIPVEEYLKTQGRFRHIFEPVRREDAINAIQEQVDDIGHRWSVKPPLSSPRGEM